MILKLISKILDAANAIVEKLSGILAIFLVVNIFNMTVVLNQGTKRHIDALIKRSELLTQIVVALIDEYDENTDKRIEELEKEIKESIK